MSDEATRQVKRIILQTTIASGALGVILSPIPLADELLLVPIYAVMTARIGRARGLRLGSVPWSPIGAAIVGGLAARAAANVSFAFIPGVAAVANAVSAVALTRLIGAYADSACESRAASVTDHPAGPGAPSSVVAPA
jgi:uncharacterized protein (DUF697 family)